MRTFVIILALCSFLLPGLALANGYDVYACPVAWSPDGKQVAAIIGLDWPYHSGSAQGELVLADHRGHCEPLLAGELASPCFGPYGEWLLVVLDGDLVAYNLEHGNAVWLTVRGDVLDCCFAPQLEPEQPITVFFSAGNRFYGSDVYAMEFSPDGGSLPGLVTHTGLSASGFGPSVSPDGMQVLFLHQYGFDGPEDSAAYERVYWMPTVDIAQQLTLPQQRADDYHESNIVWLDSDTVLFQRGGWGDWRLIRKELPDGAEIIVLTDAQQPSVSADGEWLAFTRRKYSEKEETQYDWELPSSVWAQKVGMRRLRRISEPGVYAAHPALSPDGSRIAWLEWGGNGVQLRQLRLGSN